MFPNRYPTVIITRLDTVIKRVIDRARSFFILRARIAISIARIPPHASFQQLLVPFVSPSTETRCGDHRADQGEDVPDQAGQHDEAGTHEPLLRGARVHDHPQIVRSTRSSIPVCWMDNRSRLTNRSEPTISTAYPFRRISTSGGRFFTVVL